LSHFDKIWFIRSEIIDEPDSQSNNKGSPLQGLVNILYESLHNNLKPVRSAWKINEKYGGDFEAYLKGEFSEKVLHKVKEADKQGRRIYVGSLSSEETMTELFFCCDSFEWENDKLYVNGLKCLW